MVYAPSLEAEADAMAEEARLGWKGSVIGPAAERPGIPTLGQPFEIWEGSYQIAAGAGSRLAGSVRVHESGASAIEITDLKVRSEFRRRGIGRILVHAALQTGVHLAKKYAVLASGDSGSGRLSRWYERMGFARSGFQRGYVEYAVKIPRALAGIGLFTARPLCGLIQCMELPGGGDDERRRKREEKFAYHLNLDKDDKEKKLTIVRRLTQLLISAIHEYAMGITSVEVVRRATEHGDDDPARTFFTALESAAGSNQFHLIEVEDVNGEEINITVRLSNNWTVTASYSFRYKHFRVFHSGKTASGVGYGTRLGDY